MESCQWSLAQWPVLLDQLGCDQSWVLFQGAPHDMLDNRAWWNPERCSLQLQVQLLLSLLLLRSLLLLPLLLLPAAAAAEALLLLLLLLLSAAGPASL